MGNRGRWKPPSGCGAWTHLWFFLFEFCGVFEFGFSPILFLDKAQKPEVKAGNGELNNSLLGLTFKIHVLCFFTFSVSCSMTWVCDWLVAVAPLPAFFVPRTVDDPLLPAQQEMRKDKKQRKEKCKKQACEQMQGANHQPPNLSASVLFCLAWLMFSISSW